MKDKLEGLLSPSYNQRKERKAMTKAQQKAKAKERYIKLYDYYIYCSDCTEEKSWNRALADVVNLQMLLEDLQIASEKDFDAWNQEVYTNR